MQRDLGIDAKLLNQEWKVYLDTQNTVTYDVSRSSWIGDYADPNTFLDLFVTGGGNNRTGVDDEAAVSSDEVEPIPTFGVRRAERLQFDGRLALVADLVPHSGE